MIFPTLILAIWITWINRDNISELVHNLAICSWICANSTWMIGEFYFDDSLRPLSIGFFMVGISITAVYYIGLIWKKLKTNSNTI